MSFSPEPCPDNTVAQILLVVEKCRADMHIFTLFQQNGTQKSQDSLLCTYANKTDNSTLIIDIQS